MSDLHLLRNDTFETLFQTVKREIAQVSEHIQDTAGFFKDSNEHRSLESIQVSNFFTHCKQEPHLSYIRKEVKFENNSKNEPDFEGQCFDSGASGQMDTLTLVKMFSMEDSKDHLASVKSSTTKKGESVSTCSDADLLQ